MSLCLMLMFFCSDLEKLSYAAGYIPNVQFAPIYVAISRGYYREAGIELTLDYTLGPDIFKLVALKKVDLGSADPDAFLHAVVRDLPLVHVATLYQHYPIALISKKDILKPHGLRGKRVGISGTYGSSYLGLKAMLAELDLALTDIKLASIGFTQALALQQDRVDVVVGYINNEPVRLRSQGITTHTYTLAEGSRIPGVGIMTSRGFFDEHRALVDRFLAATFRGMHDVILDPAACFRIAVDDHLPELKSEERYAAEYQILLATLPFWQSAYIQSQGYGQCDQSTWENLAALLKKDRDRGDYHRWNEWVNRDFQWQPPKPGAAPP